MKGELQLWAYHHHSYGLPPIRLGGSGLVGSTAVGRGGLNPLKTPGGGSPSAKGYPAIKNCHVKKVSRFIETSY